MRILVIGNGFIGSVIAERLFTEGHDVHTFSRSLRLGAFYKQSTGDVFKFEDLSNVLHWNPEVIVHTAWITKRDVYRNDPVNLQYAKFTIALAEYVAQSNVRQLIVLGTCAEYGAQENTCIAGITQLSPTNFYAEQKVVSFRSVLGILERTNVKFNWARIFYPYGPYQDKDRLIPFLINSLKESKPIQLVDTNSIYDWVTTRDIASAISWMISHDLPVEVDIGTSQGFTNLQVLAVLERILQTKNSLSGSVLCEIDSMEKYVAGVESALFTSGWTPQDSLVTGLKWVITK